MIELIGIIWRGGGNYSKRFYFREKLEIDSEKESRAETRAFERRAILSNFLDGCSNVSETLL